MPDGWDTIARRVTRLYADESGRALAILCGTMVTARPSRISLEQLAGRLLALCLHPVAAWRIVSPGERGLIVSVYIAASYLGVLTYLVCSR